MFWDRSIPGPWSCKAERPLRPRGVPRGKPLLWTCIGVLWVHVVIGVGGSGVFSHVGDAGASSFGNYFIMHCESHSEYIGRHYWHMTHCGTSLVACVC